jgi:hypothetical protein
MADDLLGVLTRFHREVVLPDIERIVDERISSEIAPFWQEMLSHFDAIHKRFDRLETQYGSTVIPSGARDPGLESGG